MLIATVTARRHDGGEFIEIKFDDGLQGGGSGSVAEAVLAGGEDHNGDYLVLMKWYPGWMWARTLT